MMSLARLPSIRGNVSRTRRASGADPAKLTFPQGQCLMFRTFKPLLASLVSSVAMLTCRTPGVMAMLLLSATQANAEIIATPSSLNPGDQYRLAFVTSGTIDATSSDIATYNTFVTVAANVVPELAALNTSWFAVASTSTIDARDNTGTNPGLSAGVPIFLLNDTKLVDSNTDLWDGTIDTKFNRTAADTESTVPFHIVWTGSLQSGVKFSDNDALGQSEAVVGFTTQVDTGWVASAIPPTSQQHFLYAMSAPLTVPALNGDPIADAGQDASVECMGPLTAVALNGTGSGDPDGDELEFEWSVAAGSGATLDYPSSPTPTGQFPLGLTLVTLTVTDGYGGISNDDVLVRVADTWLPVLVCTTNFIELWPPNHEMRQVEVCIAVSDDCANPEDLLLSARVSSNEPDDGTGDGATVGDVNGFDGFSNSVGLTNLAYDADAGCYLGVVWLRAERDGADTGRAYSIVCDVLDTAGNFVTASCVVVVPHDKRKK
jgi:hypothetical protein